MQQRCFKELCRRYQESHRAYHTLQHIGALLQLLKDDEYLVQNSQSIALAIWYHDAIYQLWRPRNEWRSAQLARRRLKLIGAPGPLADRVTELILATCGHQASSEDSDALFFLDCDLSVLGATKADYHNYTLQIRREYHCVPTFLYRRARRQLLERWLQGDLLQTPELRQRWEN